MHDRRNMKGRQMTKTQFLADYRASLLATQAWAGVEATLDRFMQSVERTIRTEAKTWNHDSPLADKLWRAAGNKGRATLKGLRALPD
jgi:hypothetical protein